MLLCGLCYSDTAVQNVVLRIPKAMLQSMCLCCAARVDQLLDYGNEMDVGKHLERLASGAIWSLILLVGSLVSHAW